MARRRDKEPVEAPADDMPVFVVDGLPYIDAGWLEKRIYRDTSRASRWRQDAGRFYWRTDRIGRDIRAAYLTQSLQASYRVERWRRNLALTQAAIVSVQKDTRARFGELVRERRIAAGLSLIGLSRLAGLDDKTIGNVERAGFFISRTTIEALLGVPELRLSWADVGQELLEENPADGRKYKAKRRSKTDQP